MNDLNKVLFTIILFLLIGIGLKLIFWGSFNQTVHDFYFHYSTAAGKTLEEKIELNEGHHGKHVFETYPPLWKWISIPFAGFGKEFYYFFTLLFFAFIPVLLLYWKTKSGYSAWFYFTASAFFWRLDYFATFAQYLAILILMIAIIKKDTLTRLILMPLALLSHNLGLHLLLFYYLIDYGLPLMEKALLKLKNKAFFLFYPIVNNIKGRIPGTQLAPNSIGITRIFFLMEYNLIYLIVSLGGLIKEKSLFLFSFLLILIGAFEYRIWWVLSYIALIGLIQYFELSDLKTRKKLLFFSLITLSIQLYSFSVLNIR